MHLVVTKMLSIPVSFSSVILTCYVFYQVCCLPLTLSPTTSVVLSSMLTLVWERSVSCHQCHVSSLWYVISECHVSNQCCVISQCYVISQLNSWAVLFGAKLGKFLVASWEIFCLWKLFITFRDRLFSNLVLHAFPGMLLQNGFHQWNCWVLFS